MRDANTTGRGDSTSWSHSNQGRSQPSDWDRRETDHNDQARHSRDATAIATAFEHLNRSLETFLLRLSKTSDCSEKFRRVLKKTRCYRDESDVCIDSWIEVMKLHF